jgi:hypothetical protein
MNPMPELTPMLKELRLSGVMDSLEQRNRQAIEEKLAYTDFLALILQDEVARRAQKKLAIALRRANFRNHKTLEQLDFTFNPAINRSLIADLATLSTKKSPCSLSAPAAPVKSTSPKPWYIAPSAKAKMYFLPLKSKCCENSTRPGLPIPMSGSLTSSPK